MNKQLSLYGIIAVSLIVLVIGCAKPYVITTDLERPLAHTSTVSVGEITDEFPLDFDPAKKPTVADIARFKDLIMDQLSGVGLFRTEPSADTAEYEVQGAILDYKKGSGAARFFIGFGVGNAKVTTTLRLVDKKTNATLFSGNFTGTVSDWGTKGNKVFDATAKNFAKALKSKMKKLAKAQPK